MSLLQCPECSSQVSSKTLKCISCGFPISQTPLMIAYESPIARVLSQPKTRPAITKFIEDDELPEKREYQDGLICLQCGSGITPDEMNCSHCKTLIMRRYCSHCSKLIPDHAAVCPLCNKDVKEHFLYSKLRRAKIFLGVGSAAIFILASLILFWQQSASTTTSLQADAISKPEMPLPDTKSAEPIAPPPATIKPEFKPPHEVRKAPKNLHEEEPIKSEVKQSEPEIPKLAKVEEPPANSVWSAAAQRALELKSQQRILKGRSLNHKGYSLIKEGRPSDAIPLLEQAVRSFPEDKRDLTYAYALFNLAVAYRMSGRPDIAIPLLKERIKINNQRDVVERELLAAKRQARLSGMSESEFN